MKVKVIKSKDEIYDFDIVSNNIYQVVLGIALHNVKLCHNIKTTEYAYILRKGDDYVSVDENLINMEIEDFDELIISKKVKGHVIDWIFYILLVISIVLSVVSYLLSPTPSFSDDPSQEQEVSNQKSSLFNGPRNNVEQGGAIALVLGKLVHCGMTRISGSVKSEDVPI
jgi:hypothetical protein